MLRTILAAVAIISTLALAPTAAAQPKFCAKATLYVTACVDGGPHDPGPTMGYIAGDGKMHFLRTNTYDNMTPKQRANYRGY